MSNKNQYSHIESFKDFKMERVQLYYNIQLAEKKLDLTIFNIKTHLSLEKVLYNLLLSNVVDPMFISVRNMVAGWFKKLRQKMGIETKDKENHKIE